MSYQIDDYTVYFKYTTIRIISNDGRTFQLESDDFIGFDKVLSNNNITIKLNSNNIILCVDNNKYYIPEIREDFDFKDIQIIELKKIINQFDDKIKLLEEQVKTSQDKIKLLTNEIKTSDTKIKSLTENIFSNIDKNSIYIDGCALSIPINITDTTLIITNDIIHISNYNGVYIKYYLESGIGYAPRLSNSYIEIVDNNITTFRYINSIDENIKKLEKLETLEIIRTSCHNNKPICLDYLKHLNNLHTLTLSNCCDTFIKDIMLNTKLNNIKTLVINNYFYCCSKSYNNISFNTNCLEILKYLPLLEMLIIKRSFRNIWANINNFSILSQLNNNINIEIYRDDYLDTWQPQPLQRNTLYEQEIYNKYFKK